MNKTLTFVTLSFLAASTYAADLLNGAKKPTDPEITEILLTIHSGEIDAGKLAKRKTDNSDVKELDEMMITDHKSTKDRTKDLAKKLEMKPTETPTSENLEKDHEMTEKKLKKLKGAEFDREYINAMVAGHQSVLDTIDSSLIPSAQNPELKAFLEQVRPSVANHLQHAKSLQAKLSGGKDSGQK
jgi:putative membrane protein